MKKTLSIVSIMAGFLLLSGAALAGTEGSYNTFYGINAGHSSGSIARNTFIGVNAGYSNNAGSWNTCIGAEAGSQNISGSWNVFIGGDAGSNSTGTSNIFIGGSAGNKSTGSSNTIIGNSAGSLITSGDNNVFLGNLAGSAVTTGSNKLYIDNCRFSDINDDCNKPFIYGDFETRILKIDGTITMVTVASPSDLRYKKDIRPLESSLEKVMRLKGISYEWNKDAVDGAGFKGGRQIGFIAQEMEPILPELVQTDSKGYKTLSYDKLVPVLVEAIKEQQKVIDQKSRMLDEQQAAIKMLSGKLEKLDKIEAKLNRLESKNISARE